MTPTLLVLLISFLRGTIVHGAPNSCVAASEDEYICTNDPIGTREILEKNSLMGPLHTMGRGVVQRIDGSETEKSAVKEILKKMDDYFVHEVFSKSDFEIVRGRW
jgi:hypothetical protein